MRYLIVLFFSSVAFAHSDNMSFKPSKPASRFRCEFTLSGEVDWTQALLKEQTELKQVFETRSGSRLWSPWKQALEKAGAIEQALSRMPEEKREYFARIHSALNSALTKHQLAFVKSRDVNKMDVPRHMKILAAIAAFDEAKPEFSLYKIKRAIEGRYSLREYSDCR